jgi:methionine synthase I (cobalamin-dependent)
MAAMSSKLLDRLHRGPPLLMDGAMGTELIRTGSDCGGNLTWLNLSRPDLVLAVHRAYAAAGAEVILTNTFQANPVTIPDPMELQRVGNSAVELARKSGADYVLSDIGPIITARYTEFENPDDLQRTAEAIPATDGILLETCSSINALKAIEQLRRAVRESPILLSLAFCHRPDGLVTYDGHTPEWFAERVRDHGVDGLGVNCGLEISPTDCVEVIRRFRQMTDLPLFARPNAGTPKLVADGGMIYPRSIAEFASAIDGLIDAGAMMIGGCCGTTPAHIAATSEQITTPGPV